MKRNTATQPSNHPLVERGRNGRGDECHVPPKHSKLIYFFYFFKLFVFLLRHEEERRAFFFPNKILFLMFFWYFLYIFVSDVLLVVSLIFIRVGIIYIYCVLAPTTPTLVRHMAVRCPPTHVLL